MPKVHATPTLHRRAVGWNWLHQFLFATVNTRARESDEVWRLLNIPFTIDESRGRWLRVGRVWIKKRDAVPVETAAAYYTKFLRRNPRCASAYVARGVARHEAGELDLALEDYAAALRLSPSSVEAHVNRGSVWHQMGKFEDALHDINEAIRLGPQRAEGYFGRALARTSMGELARAVDDFNEAIRLKPELVSVYEYRGAVWHAQGELDKALEDYNKALELSPLATATLCNRAMAWHAKGEYGRALDDYTAAIQLAPHEHEAYSGRAWLRATCPVDGYRDGAAAVADATKACELSEWKVGLCVGTLAAATAETGDFAAAIAWLQKAIDLDGDSDAEVRTTREGMFAMFRDSKPFRDVPE